MKNLQSMKIKKGTDPIICYGAVRNFGTEEEPSRLCSNINYSDILSKLIMEAGTTCKHYASDLFISWENLLLDISKIETEKAEMIRYFGFRESGVDHESYILTKLSAPDCYGKHPYQSIYRLTVLINKEQFTMKLEQIQ